MTAPERPSRFRSADPGGRAAVPTEAVQALAKLLSERVGLRPAPQSEARLRLAILARLETLGEADAAAYVEGLGRGDGRELRALLPLVTVGKTEFFRGAIQLQALRGSVLPRLLAQARSERRPLCAWSAGCATGEEPYSIAMLALELGAAPEELELLATDVNPAAVAAAASGRYPAGRMKAVPEALVDRYWRVQGEELVTGPALGACVRFAVHNLAAAAFPAPERAPAWDLVACRNVIIYFDPLTTVRVVRGLFEHLRGGGILCLGYSESLYHISGDFELVEVDGAFLYRRPLGRGPGSPAAACEEVAPAPAQSQGRSAACPAPAPRLSGPLRQAEAAREEDPLAAAAADLEAGRFEEAVAVLRSALQRAPGDLALRITLGNALTVLRRAAEARAAYESALAVEPLCKEARLFLGILCFEEGASRDEETARELGRVLFLDSDCALAHYYLGRLHERRADFQAARRHYRSAVEASRARGGPRPLLGYCPDLPADPSLLGEAAECALRALERRAV